MKLHIVLPGQKTSLKDGWHQVAVDQLDTIVQSSCKEIDARDIIDYVDTSVFKEILSKLRHGGKIEVSGIDMYEMSRQIFAGVIKPDEVREIVAGVQSIYFLSEVSTILENNGIVPTEKNIGRSKYFIAGTRK